MAKYKPGQFIKIDIPGRYRVHKVKLGFPCETCDLKDICWYHFPYKSTGCISCTEAIGPYTNVKKVK